MNVCLIERNRLGGTCLNVGCIPTKFLLNASGKYASIDRLTDMGIDFDEARIDFQRMMGSKNRVVDQLEKGIKFLISKNRIKRIKGTARFIDPKSLRVNGDEEEEVKAENVIIAAGSRPIVPSQFDSNRGIVCTSDEALSWPVVPNRLLIVGGGVVGCEIAVIYANLGAQVTIVEMQDRLLPLIDGELGEFAYQQMKKKNVQVFCGTKVEHIDKTVFGVTCDAFKREPC